MTNTRKELANAGTAETGLTLSKRYGYIIVLSVLPDSPGTKAGIRSGDIFESISDLRHATCPWDSNQSSQRPGRTGIKVGVIRAAASYAGGSRSRSGEVVRRRRL